MRLWSIHPKYLDTKGLVALWRETLLAKNVILGNTKGYKNHPQLLRFKTTQDPLAVIDQYLSGIFQEASMRNYQFDHTKFKAPLSFFSLDVTEGQLAYEKKHLLQKLKIRDAKKYTILKSEPNIDAHPIFNVIEGGIERWEIIP